MRVLAVGFALVVLSAATAAAQATQPITEIQLDQEGRPVNDTAVISLLETHVGDVLSVRSVRETIAHLMSLGRYEDVQVFSEPAGSGVRLKYVLLPRHPVDRVEFRGTTGISVDDLRRVVTDRFGAAPSATRAPDVGEALRIEYRRRGYTSARVTPRVDIFHDPDRATLVLDVDAGSRTKILGLKMTQVDATNQSNISESPDIKEGQPYDEVQIAKELQAWENRMRSRGFYEARASQSAQFADNDSVFVFVNLERGPNVIVRIEGDPLPKKEVERLVPIKAEASADEDLLEDSKRAIETYLYGRGYRDATADYTREERGGDLIITFTVKQGPRFVVRDVMITGNKAIPTPELTTLIRLKEGEPFVRASLAQGIGSIERTYRASGFAQAQVKPGDSVLATETASEERPVSVTVAIVEGPRTLVRSVTFQGRMALSDADLRTVTALAPGRPYAGVEVIADRDRIVQAYHDRGYDNVSVTPEPTFAENNTAADVRYTIVEGQQIIVDHVIIAGNRRISTATIEQEILLRSGQPFGDAAVAQTRRNLDALELFRRIQIEALGHSGDTKRDVLVQVEEGPSTTLDLGGGVEGGYIARPTGQGGVAEESFEVAPRGFFQIGRQNLWGKNRSITLFTRVSLRSRDTLPDVGTPIDPNQPFVGSYGFHEYRVLTTYREPRIMRTRADFLVTGIIEQAIRTSFNFSRREVLAQLGSRFWKLYNLSGAYSFQRTKLFDLRANPDELPLIDRLFPQVRLSKFSGTIVRDSRETAEALDPSHGTLLIATNDLAARAIGSEVGFIKTYLQGFLYHQLPGQRRTVAAFGARVGVAHAFGREIDGTVVNVGLPASERFFAGGDASVRGFALDRLGNAQTITDTGFPTGGNSVVVLNSELRVFLFKNFTGIGFMDAGNVFPLASDLDFTDLRPAAGFGLMYKSPIGPIRIDLGYNLDPQEFVPGSPERRRIFHFLLGHAF